jgi:hypothetical protein
MFAAFFEVAAMAVVTTNVARPEAATKVAISLKELFLTSLSLRRDGGSIFKLPVPLPRSQGRTDK